MDTIVHKTRLPRMVLEEILLETKDLFLCTIFKVSLKHSHSPDKVENAVFELSSCGLSPMLLLDYGITPFQFLMGYTCSGYYGEVAHLMGGFSTQEYESLYKQSLLRNSLCNIMYLQDNGFYVPRHLFDPKVYTNCLSGLLEGIRYCNPRGITKGHVSLALQSSRIDILRAMNSVSSDDIRTTLCDNGDHLIAAAYGRLSVLMWFHERCTCAVLPDRGCIFGQGVFDAVVKRHDNCTKWLKAYTRCLHLTSGRIDRLITLTFQPNPTGFLP